MTDTNIQKHAKVTVTCLKKRGLAFRLSADAVQIQGNFVQIETRKIERGIAEGCFLCGSISSSASDL